MWSNWSKNQKIVLVGVLIALVVFTLAVVWYFTYVNNSDQNKTNQIKQENSNKKSQQETLDLANSYVTINGPITAINGDEITINSNGTPTTVKLVAKTTYNKGTGDPQGTKTDLQLQTQAIVTYDKTTKEVKAVLYGIEMPQVSPPK